MPHRDTSAAINQAIPQTLNATQGHKRSYQTSYYSNLFQWATITLHRSNQSGVVILTNYFFKVHMLQDKVNRHNYNSYIKLSISYD